MTAADVDVPCLIALCFTQLSTGHGPSDVDDAGRETSGHHSSHRHHDNDLLATNENCQNSRITLRPRKQGLILAFWHRCCDGLIYGFRGIE